ncbi:MAG: hypothetical protein U0T56_02990 [Ferruginibacter sp.]
MVIRIKPVSKPGDGCTYIRMGDFRKLKEVEAFRGERETPLQYFTDIVSGLRKLAGKDLPVTLFSDGYGDELKEVTGLPQVSITGRQPGYCRPSLIEP